MSGPPLSRILPSGDELVTARVVVERPATRARTRSRAQSDWVDCAVWSAKARRQVTTWQVGDIVEIHGAIRRRFFASGGVTTTRVEVEVLQARRRQRGVPGAAVNRAR